MFSLDEINECFSGIAFDPLVPSVSEFLDSLSSSSTSTGFEFREIQLNEVILAIQHFSTEATGTDSIPLHVIKITLPSIEFHLQYIFSRSLRESIFPTEWKGLW